MNTPKHQNTRKISLTLAATTAILLTSTSTHAWWGPGGPPVGGWDPHEAYLHEYGFLDRHGPTMGDLRRMHRDNWKLLTGHPVYLKGVGPYGPTYSDVIRQQRRKHRRFWGYPY